PVVATSTSAAPPVDLSGKKLEFEAPLKPAVVTACRTKKSFTTKEPIRVTVGLEQAPDELTVTLRALDGEKEVASVQKPAERLRSVTLELPPLREGRYVLETSWGGNVVCEDPIEVSSASGRSGAGNAPGT
ncbi:MAG TPA: hypothetical protein VHL59_10265, partial [Thermoanaerobaculia bacterium]|nr:hypothetical protein [Thermoanaerobaculia bacterium]